MRPWMPLPWLVACSFVDPANPTLSDTDVIGQGTQIGAEDCVPDMVQVRVSESSGEALTSTVTLSQNGVEIDSQLCSICSFFDVPPLTLTSVIAIADDGSSRSVSTEFILDEDDFNEPGPDSDCPGFYEEAIDLTF